MSRRKRPPAAASVDPADRALFRDSVGPVRPLRSDRVQHPPRRPPPQPRFRQADERAVLRDMLSDAFDAAELETGEELLFARPGLQGRLLKRLRRGQLPIDAECDLHGLTVAEARQVLAEFLLHSRLNRQCCVRIIHGKGHGSVQRIPVLKRKVDHWLRQRDEVLAFCSARPVDGGTGAVYVLLKALR
ncbi:Smr/MutS family protein [Thiohalobacter sp. IOR34]|uniref:Smr/MutS family protein n=1 Tax=Thiohalobacter sp. IOR34 TaxID=3057176 RepID=UPI0025B011D1|nr:Smr/MutS family protein [Thiohalobacter sp. IOR34]WJW76606.1 Smr/MutS family protein [Thiohalobacter sp. IOR34]